jgi:hypothetical protein
MAWKQNFQKTDFFTPKMMFSHHVVWKKKFTPCKFLSQQQIYYRKTRNRFVLVWNQFSWCENKSFM